MAHVLWVLEDGLKLHQSDRQLLELAVGKAVLSACIHPQFEWTDHGRARIRALPVLNHCNGVNHAGEVHSSDEQVFVWTDNCLRTLNEIGDKDLDRVKAVFDRLYEQRRKRRAVRRSVE